MWINGWRDIVVKQLVKRESEREGERERKGGRKRERGRERARARETEREREKVRKAFTANQLFERCCCKATDTHIE